MLKNSFFPEKLSKHNFFTCRSRLTECGGAERKQKAKWFVEMLGFNYYEGCVRSVQIPNLTNKTFLNFPYIFQVLKTWREFAANKNVFSYKKELNDLSCAHKTLGSPAESRFKIVNSISEHKINPLRFCHKPDVEC